MPETATTHQLRAALGGYRRRGRPDNDPEVQQTRRALALRRVEEKIAAAVAEAPPLPEDLAARLVDLIRATPAPERG